MRRALLAFIAGGTLLAGAACDRGTDDTPQPTAPSAAAESLPPLPDYSADTKLACGRLASIYTSELRAFGTAVGRMVTYKEAKQAADAKKAENTAAAQLTAAAAKIRKETATAADPDFREAGAASAAKLERSAKDRAYFKRVKSLKDLDASLKTQMGQWLTPVAGYCPTSPRGQNASVSPVGPGGGR